MKNSFLLAGIAALMLSACNNKPAQELTLSGLNPVNFQTCLLYTSEMCIRDRSESGEFSNRSEQCPNRSLHLKEQVGHGSMHH